MARAVGLPLAKRSAAQHNTLQPASVQRRSALSMAAKEIITSLMGPYDDRPLDAAASLSRAAARVSSGIVGDPRAPVGPQRG